MKVLLIRPPYTRLKGMGQAPYFPLGLGYISAVLNSNGVQCMIYHAENPRGGEEELIVEADAIFESRSKSQRMYSEALADDSHQVWRETREVLREYEPDLVGISLLSVEVGSAIKLSQIVKAHNPSCKVVWGGMHPTFMPEECLSYGNVDFVIRGEGETPMLELCRALESDGNLSGVKGLSYPKEGGVVHNGLPGPIDLDSLPYPDRENVFFPESFDFKSLGSMIISRGCPFRCSFCSSRNFWDKKVRLRSPENVLKEIRHLVKTYGTRYIMFWDDSFTINRNVITKYCNALIESGMKISWRTATRADLIEEELLDIMARSGCVKLEIGVESGSERMRKLIYKDITDEQIYGAFNLINSKGIGVGAFFMAGFPEETLDDMQTTFEMMKRLGATSMAFNVFDPMPGSTEYEKCIELGLVPENADWRDFPFWPDAHYMKFVSPDEFRAKAVEIARWLFSYNNSFTVKFRRTRQYVRFMLFHDPVFLMKRIASFLLGRSRARSAVKGSGKEGDK